MIWGRSCKCSLKLNHSSVPREVSKYPRSLCKMAPMFLAVIVLQIRISKCIDTGTALAVHGQESLNRWWEFNRTRHHPAEAITHWEGDKKMRLAHERKTSCNGQELRVRRFAG
jgi:hypothetical protein